MLCVHWKTQQHAHTNKTIQTNSVDAILTQNPQKSVRAEMGKNIQLQDKCAERQGQNTKFEDKKVWERGNDILYQLLRISKIRPIGWLTPEEY